jgi:hypothetical protein
MGRRRLVDFATPAIAAALAVAATGLGSPTDSPPRCRTRQLHLAPTFYGEAGGEFTQTLTFVNASRRPCSLRGWPRLSLQSKSGGLVRVASRRVRQGEPGTPAFRTVVLRSRHAASFDVYGSDWHHAASRPCSKTRIAWITPPGAYSSLSVAVKMPNCGRFYIAPVVAGGTDRQSWSLLWSG